MQTGYVFEAIVNFVVKAPTLLSFLIKVVLAINETRTTSGKNVLNEK